MVKDISDNVEEKIIDAAADVFEERGYSGARMQQIADKAGINKALLHYYFRSKEKLFEKVFTIVAKRAFKKFGSILNDDGSVFKKIELFLDLHQDLLWKNRKFPIFFLNEVNQNPNLVKNVFKEINQDDRFVNLLAQVEDEQKKGIIRNDINPKNLLVNIISLSIFPYVGSPVIAEMMLSLDSDFDSEEFLKEHRKQVANFVINSIKA